MLEDREWESLFEIERRLLIEDPEPARRLGVVRLRRSSGHHRGSDVVAAVAGLTLCVVLLIGPRRLTDAEIVVLGSAVPPRRSRGRPGATAIPRPH